MSFLDSIKSTVTDAMSGNANVMNIAKQLLDENGGVEGLVAKFKAAGFENVIQSWVSNGTNLSITPEQINTILGSSQIQSLAAKFGFDAKAVSSTLATGLPMFIDKLSPEGKIPSMNDIASKISSLKGLFS